MTSPHQTPRKDKEINTMQTTLVAINWYKASGKWHAGQNMRIPITVQPFVTDAVKQYIVDNQTQLVHGWIDSGYTVTVNTIEQPEGSNLFYERLFLEGSFRHITKTLQPPIVISRATFGPKWGPMIVGSKICVSGDMTDATVVLELTKVLDSSYEFQHVRK